MSASPLAHSTSTNDKTDSVVNTLRLAPGTITRISEGWDEKPEWARKRRAENKQREPEVSTLRVDPKLWAEAKRLAGGDWRRLEVISATNVFIHNKPWR